MGLFTAVAAVAGAVISSVISSKSDKASDKRQLSNTETTFRDQWNYKRNQGLTPYEIVGTPTTHSPTPSNTLGSNQAFKQAGAQIAQMKFTAEQAQKDRDSRKEVAQIQTQPHKRQAGVAEGRLGLEEKLNPLKAQQIISQTKQIQAQTQLTQKQVDQYWPTIFAKMGPENVMTALAAFNSGISLEQVLQAEGNPSPETREAIEALYARLLLAQDIVGKKVLTAKELKKQVVDYIPNLIKDVKAIGKNQLGQIEANRAERKLKHPIKIESTHIRPFR